MITAVIFLFLLPFTTAMASTSMGVTYTCRAPLPPNRVRAAASAFNFHSIRLPNPEPSLIQGLTKSSLFLAIGNELLPHLAASPYAAKQWVTKHVLPFRGSISLITVGEDAYTDPLPSLLLPAVKNVYQALQDLGIGISVSTSFNFFDVITDIFPPSSAAFRQPLADGVVKPLLQFLESTSSPLVVSIYPYFQLIKNGDFPLGFALFEDNPALFHLDELTGIKYSNLFDVMVDSVVVALGRSGHENLTLVVGKTGWPSRSGSTDVYATSANAEIYLKKLLAHIKSGCGRRSHLCTSMS